MITLENGKTLSGSALVELTIRNDLAPIPVTVEGTFRIDEEKFLNEGKTFKLGTGDKIRIIKSKKVKGTVIQDGLTADVIQVIGVLDSCHKLCFTAEKDIIKEKVPLSNVYKLCGSEATVTSNDFQVDRFYLLRGDVPTFHIARALQEAGGVARWKKNKIDLIKLQEFESKKPERAIPAMTGADESFEWMERHEVSSFFSAKPDGSILWGNEKKPRDSRFIPLKEKATLVNMTRCLVRKRMAKIPLDQRICAGDVVLEQGNVRWVVITAAHLSVEGLTQLWLGKVE